MMGIENVLTSREYQECLDYILKHNEWLLGLEFAIDALVEDDRKIKKENFIKFEEAYSLMGLESDTRLKRLKMQIIE